MKRIEKPLANLLADLCIPPALATLILDTRVDENWIPAIVEFERRLDTLKLRVRVKAARDLSEVVEGLRIVVSLSIPILTFIPTIVSARLQQNSGLSSCHCLNQCEPA